MVAIQLREQTVQIDPPQQIALLEVVRASDGASLTVVHGSFEERDLRLVGRSPDLTGPKGVGEEDSEMPGIPEVFLAAFPLLREIDLRQPPPEYRKVATSDFDLEPGQRYSVWMVGGVMVQTTLVAT